ncbi:cation transporter [Butyrivibrio sp. VCD2006]|uniref:cation transporter n=1 Tax=Butyrivibrio sp. VCD2006 TaxID=1280664 RepID=UPI00040886F2|nr:cation transporter [Butyrivibrio sp. VCD2006]
MDTDKSIELEKQQKISFILVVWRFPVFFTSLLAALASGSVVVWLEFAETASILIPGVILYVLSKKLNANLKYKFNYGSGKVEAITALACELSDLAGLFCVTFVSIKELFTGSEKSEALKFALILSIIGFIIDAFIMWRQKKLLENSSSKMFHTAFVSAWKEFAFDGAAIVTLVISLKFQDSDWIGYFSPIVCLLMVIPFSLIVLHHLRESVEELIDRTLDEESQLKIIKVLNEFFDSYEELGEVKSRITGQEKYIDIELVFKEDMEYREVRQIATKIKDRVQEEMENSNVNIVIL